MPVTKHRQPIAQQKIILPGYEFAGKEAIKYQDKGVTMSAGELGGGMRGGERAMDEVKNNSDAASARTKEVGSRLMALSQMAKDLHDGLAGLLQSPEVNEARSTAHVAHDEADTANRALSGMATGSNNPNVQMIPGLLGALSEATDTTEKNFKWLFDDMGEPLEDIAEIAGILKSYSSQLGAMADEADVQGGIAISAKEAMQSYNP